MSAFMGTTIALFSLAILLLVSKFINYGWPNYTKKALKYKMAASSLLIIYAFLLALQSHISMKSGVLICFMLALGFNWFGDAFLSGFPLIKNNVEKNSRIFVGVGMGCYMAGFIMYIDAFIRLGRLRSLGYDIRYFALILLLFGILAIWAVQAKLKFGKILPLVCLYALLACTMLGTAYYVTFFAFGSLLSKTLISAATILYVVSQICLGMKNFGDEKYNTLGLRTAYISFYYFSQLLLASTIAFI